MTRFRPSLALIALAGALLVACGGDGGGAPAARPSPQPAGQVRLTYYGHSMFTIETPGGVTVLTDPNQGMGYRAPEVAIDVITVSHDHFDHDKIGVARGALVLRGLISDGDWSDVDTTIGDVRIRSARSYHDEQQG